MTAFDQAFLLLKEGDCYKCAYEAMLRGNPDWADPRLIHATALGSPGSAIADQPYGHAYVAYQKALDFPPDMLPDHYEGKQPMMEMVHDPMAARDKGVGDMPRALYERMYGRINEETLQSYDHDEMMGRIQENQHYGPWDGSV